jgi:membrane-associated protease RseP (regulator of RpoE activity)
VATMPDDGQSTLQGTASQLQQAVGDLFSVHDVTLGIPGQPETIRLRGELQIPSEDAYPQIAARLRRMGYTTYLRDDPDHDLQVLLAVPEAVPQEVKSRMWLNALLFVLTILSTLFVGATWSDLVPPDADPLWILTHLWIGWPFALSLMTILTGHELGHYFAGRYYKVPVSLPFFIPLPVPPLGTMGAFIVMKGRTVDRRQMLTVGAAGPLVGFVLAVPILILGLFLSTVQPMVAPEPGMAVFLEGNSLLYLLLKFAVFGQVLPGSGAAPADLVAFLGEAGAALTGTYPIDRGYDVFVHSVALAGWAGLLVTALNLLPVGQLDGGHVLYSLVGQRARILTWPIIGLLLLLGILFWQGWLLWAGLIFFFGQSHPDPLDDVTRLDTSRKIVAVAVLCVFVLTFSLLPLRLVSGDALAVESGSTASCLAIPGLVVALGAWQARRSRSARRAS